LLNIKCVGNNSSCVKLLIIDFRHVILFNKIISHNTILLNHEVNQLHTTSHGECSTAKLNVGDFLLRLKEIKLATSCWQSSQA